MKYPAAVIDTNVIVAGLLTGAPDSPTARTVDGMCQGVFPFLLSTALLAEYRGFLLRAKLRSLHGLSEREVDSLLTVLAANAVVREAAPLFRARTPGGWLSIAKLASVPPRRIAAVRSLLDESRRIARVFLLLLD